MIVTSLLGAALLILASPLQLNSATNFFLQKSTFFLPSPRSSSSFHQILVTKLYLDTPLLGPSTSAVRKWHYKRLQRWISRKQAKFRIGY